MHALWLKGTEGELAWGQVGIYFRRKSSGHFHASMGTSSREWGPGESGDSARETAEHMLLRRQEGILDRNGDISARMTRWHVDHTGLLLDR